MKRCRFIFIFILTCGYITPQAIAQKFIVLEKTGTKKRFQFFIGDTFIYKLEGERFYREDVITDIVDNVVVFGFGFYTFDEIDFVNVKRVASPGLRRYAPYFWIAGVGYFAIDHLNRSTDGIDETTAITSAIIAGVGTLMWFSSKNKIKVKRNWRLRSVDI